MALQAVAPFPYPSLNRYAPNVGVSNLTLNESADKIAFVGRVRWADHSTTSRAVRKVHFRFGTVTKAGGSGLTVSLQDVDLTAGPVMRPDGTQDQTVAIANGDASFASNTWYTTGALSADRTVSLYDFLSVVIEFDGGGRLGADTVDIGGLYQGYSWNPQTSGLILYNNTGAAWSAGEGHVNVLLEFADGTFGALGDGFPLSAVENKAARSGDTPNEFGNRFTVPFKCKVDGIFGLIAPGAGGDFIATLYEDNGATPTSLGSVTADSNVLRTNYASFLYGTFPFTEVTLSPSTVYYVAFKANNATNYFYLPNFSVSNNSHMAVLDGGTGTYWAERTGGAWTTTTTKRAFCGIIISALDDGVSSGGSYVIGG